MTAAITRLSCRDVLSRDVLPPAAFLAVALGIGALTGVNPKLGIAAAGALVFALIVMWDLTLGVCLFLLVTFLDVVSRNQNLSLTKGAGVVLAGSWLATVAIRRGSRGDLSAYAPRLTGALFAFVAWSAMSAFWAESSGAAAKSTLRFALNVMLFPIVFWAVREAKHVVWLFGVFIVGTLFSVLYGIGVGKVNGGAAAAQVGRLSGANVEANELATLLIVSTIFACALALVLRRSPLVRGLAVLAAFAAMGAFFATLSRSGFIALAVVILAGCVYAGKARPAFLALVLSAVLVGSVVLGSSTSGAVARLTSSNTSGRSDLWKIGLRMVRANPIIGVGSGNYTVAEPHYLLTQAGAIQRGDLIIGTPYPAHNIYLQVLAEMGVIGLALFMAIILLSLGAATKAVRLCSARGERSLEVLGRALVVSILGILAAAFFLPDQYSKQLWLLLALGPALLAIARGSPAAPADVPSKLTPPGPPARPDVAWQR